MIYPRTYMPAQRTPCPIAFRASLTVSGILSYGCSSSMNFLYSLNSRGGPIIEVGRKFRNPM